MYYCHLFLISSASVRSLPFLSFLEPIFAWNVPLVSLIFLKSSLVFPILLFFSVSLHCSLRKAFLSLLAVLWNSAFTVRCDLVTEQQQQHCNVKAAISSVQFSRSVVSDSLQPHIPRYTLGISFLFSFALDCLTYFFFFPPASFFPLSPYFPHLSMDLSLFIPGIFYHYILNCLYVPCVNCSI